MVPVDLDDLAPNGDFDTLYFDMNGIIHPCCRPEDGPAPEDEEHMYENVFLYLDRLIRIIRPKKMVYMAIDGVAPRAKMNQQRARRFRAAQEREEMDREKTKLRQEWESDGRTLPNKKLSKSFDSNVITPGTVFLHRMSEAIRYYIHDRMSNDPLWQKLKFRVILSDANIPGEGEHKILDFIRAQRSSPGYDPNVRHCLYGADADLIMLGLATHEAHFCIIREVVIPASEKKCTMCGKNGHVASECTGEAEEEDELEIKKPFQILSIPILRQYLEIQFEPMREKMENFAYDFERVVDDFVFMCFYVGNDFLPHLPSLSIRDGSIDQMITLYQEIMGSMDDWLTNAGRLNLKQVETFIEYLGGVEDQVFKNQLERNMKKQAELEEQRKAGEAGGDGAQVLETGADSVGAAAAPPAPAAALAQPSIAVKEEVPETTGAKRKKPPVATPPAASDTNAWHAQLLAQSFSMDLDNLDDHAAQEVEVKKAKKEEPEPEKRPEQPKSGKFVDREFQQMLKERLEKRQDLGQVHDSIRLGEGSNWKQRYYFEKFKVKQDDLVDFLQRIRKAYTEGLAWVLAYYYQGCASWTWFYPYHYAPFASDLVGCASLKCSDPGYFTLGEPFQPFQQLMSVLPPVSGDAAGIPKGMTNLMKQPFSPLIDFYPADFGLDLNGKRYTWMAVILLPFIDEPRLVRTLAPHLEKLNPEEKIRNRRGVALLFAHREDPHLTHVVQLAQAAFEAGHAGLKQRLANCDMYGSIEGYPIGGMARTIDSPIEGLPDVEESLCMSAIYHNPDWQPHVCQILPGSEFEANIVNEVDIAEQSRMKGFGGAPAERMILQALGINRRKFKGGGKDGGKGKGCFICGDESHWQNECPKGNGKGSKGDNSSAPVQEDPYGAGPATWAPPAEEEEPMAAPPRLTKERPKGGKGNRVMPAETEDGYIGFGANEEAPPEGFAPVRSKGKGKKRAAPY